MPADSSQTFRLLTVEQAAERMAVSPSTVRRLIRSGRLPSINLGRCRRVPSTVVEEFVQGLLDDAMSDPTRIMQP